MTHEELLIELQNNDLRLAGDNEAGYTYTYRDDNNERITVWVTDIA